MMMMMILTMIMIMVINHSNDRGFEFFGRMIPDRNSSQFTFDETMSNFPLAMTYEIA